MNLNNIAGIRRCKQIVRRYWELHALSRTTTRPFDPSALGGIGPETVRAALDNERIEGEWREFSHRFTDLTGPYAALGGVNPGDRRALYYIVRHFKPRRVLEVGTHVGFSTTYLAGAMLHTAGARLTSVDIADVNADDGPWKDLNLARRPRDLVAAIGAGQLVDFVQMRSLGFFETVPDKYDLIFLDGDHSATTVYRELTLAFSRLNSGGLIILHDYFPDCRPLWPDGSVIVGPFIAARRAQRECSTQFRIVPLGELPWPTKQRSKTTSLALICGV